MTERKTEIGREMEGGGKEGQPDGDRYINSLIKTQREKTAKN